MVCNTMVYLKLWPSLGTWDCNPVNFGFSMGFIFSDNSSFTALTGLRSTPTSAGGFGSILSALSSWQCVFVAVKEKTAIWPYLAHFYPFLFSIFILISVSTSIATKSGLLPGGWETRRASSKPFSPQGQGTFIDPMGLPHVHVEITSPRHGISSAKHISTAGS